ncbi:deoxynucleoside kinase [Macrococcus brunensis]|uniref:Deoxynucleoside kinase n=2 Tax=Macrococcus brunensis TaxID=198483 RepID=A0A4R6BDX6_9STAP|nr:deoxynucleoside kinase [Macrococcus brunensis]TDL97949.1 deoxynucleoside kinase [Macrococcus brunensis]
MMSLYIAIEGPIGVGKSSLTRMLSETLQMETLYEIVEENPFLSDFYEDINKWSFQTEMFFLCNRYKQINDLADRSVISDYHILKNKVFARNTLNTTEYAMFEKIYDVMTEDLRRPDVTIFLTAELPVLKERIKKRDRDFEMSITDDYLLTLIKDYHDVYQSTTHALFIDTTDLDFVHRPEDYDRILSQITTLLGENHV